MKRFLTYCSLAVILLIGVTSISVSRNEAVAAKAGLSNREQQSLPEQQSSFNANDLFFSAGMGKEQSRLLHSFQYLSFRTLSSLSNTARINYSIQLTQQQYFSGRTSFLLKSAFKQLDGYYLYHLRKLLI